MRRRKTVRRGKLWAWEHINRPLTDTSTVFYSEVCFLKHADEWRHVAECDKRSLDINLKGLRDLGDNGYIKDDTQSQETWNDLLRLNISWTLGRHECPFVCVIEMSEWKLWCMFYHATVFKNGHTWKHFVTKRRRCRWVHKVQESRQSEYTRMCLASERV